MNDKPVRYSAENNSGTFKLAEVIDAPAIQSMMEDFYRLTNIGCALVDLRGKVLVAVGWLDICTKFHRIHPETLKCCVESDTELSKAAPYGQCKAYRCKNNLWDASTPIVVEEKHIGNIFLGQFFYEDEAVDIEFFRKQARKYNFDEQEYLAALERVPRYRRETVDAAMKFYVKLAEMISSLAYNNLRLKTILHERIDAENSLRASEEKYRRLFETMSQGVIYQAKDGAILSANPAAERILGLSFDQMQGETSFDPRWKMIQEDGTPVPGSDHPAMIALRTGESVGPVIRGVYRPDADAYVWLKIIAIPLFQPGQSEPFQVYATIEDVSELKKSEDERTVMAERLRLANKATNDVIWDWDVKQDTQQWNQAGTVVFGWTEIVERPVNAHWWVERVHPDDRERVHDTFFGVVNNPEQNVWQDEYRFMKADGAYAIVMDRGYVLRDEHGMAIRMVGAMQDISERKRAEEALRNSEKRYKTLFHEMLNGFAVHEIICDAAGEPINYRFLTVNPAFERMTGLQADDIINKTVLDILPGTERYWIETYGKVAITGIPIYFIEYSSALEKYFEVSAFRPVPGQFACIFQDITDRVQAEKLLEDETIRRRILFEQSRDGIVVIDETGKVVESNEKFADMLGYELSEMTQLCVWDWDANWSREDIQEMIQSVDQSGDHFETRHRRKDGSIYDVDICSNGVVCNGKKLVFCVCRDITEKKKLETELIQFKTAFDSANFGAAISTIDGILRYVNNCFASMHGYSPEELVGKHLSVFHNESQMPEVNLTLQKLLTVGSYNAEEIDHVRKDGTIFTMLMTGTVLKDKNGDPEFFIATGIDMSDYIALEEQLSHAQKMDSVGRLAGGVAHDYNNMLTAILGYGEMAKSAVEPNDRLYKYIEGILNAAYRSVDITNQLLAFARKQTIQPQTIDLNHTIVDLMKMLDKLISENIKLYWFPGNSLWYVFCDSAQITQILVNLVVNARDAISDVGYINIETSNVVIDEESCARRPYMIPGEFVVISVSDNGCGMDEETLEKIFEPFYTTKTVEKGTGLGLSTVYGIVKQNKGFISVTSEPGKGSDFKIYLPRHQAEINHTDKTESKSSQITGNETGVTRFPR